MNYTEALSFAFEDKEWPKKLLIGGIFVFVGLYAALIFITGFVIMGYYIGVLRNAMNNVEKPLPPWENWPKLFVDGIMGVIIWLIYFVFIGGIAAVMIVSIAKDHGMRAFEMAMAITTVSLLALLSLSVLVNLALARFAATDDFAAAFRFSELFSLLKDNFGNYLSLSIFSFILNAILFVAGLGIFSPFTNFWGLVVQAHLFGQSVRGTRETQTMVQSA